MPLSFDFRVPTVCRLKICLKKSSRVASIAQGCYLSAWKMEQVTPLFKKSKEF